MGMLFQSVHLGAPSLEVLNGFQWNSVLVMSALKSWGHI